VDWISTSDELFKRRSSKIVDPRTVHLVPKTKYTEAIQLKLVIYESKLLDSA